MPRSPLHHCHGCHVSHCCMHGCHCIAWVPRLTWVPRSPWAWVPHGCHVHIYTIVEFHDGCHVHISARVDSSSRCRPTDNCGNVNVAPFTRTAPFATASVTSTGRFRQPPKGMSDCEGWQLCLCLWNLQKNELIDIVHLFLLQIAVQVKTSSRCGLAGTE